MEQPTPRTGDIRTNCYHYKISKDGFHISGTVKAGDTGQAKLKAFHQHACAGNSIVVSDIKIHPKRAFARTRRKRHTT